MPSPARNSVERVWALIAASDRSSAEAYARDHALRIGLVLTKDDLLGRPRHLAAMVRDARVDGVLVHSADWQRQRNPQLYELALALMRLSERYVADDRTGTVTRIGRADAAARVARMPVHAVQAVGVIAAQAARLAANGRREPVLPPLSGRRSILALWPGGPSGFGGSITHITGILDGFRRSGYRIGLLTCFVPPEDLLSIVDDVVVVPPLPPSRRINSDLEQLGWNRPLRDAGAALARRIRPAFVYQRHCPFLIAGAEIAEGLAVPLVLEWNGSELWVRDNWQTQLPVERLLRPLLAAMESNVLSRSTLIASVSQEAASMALEAGAPAARTFVLPNAVDIERVDQSLSEMTPAPARNGDGVLLGWAGSFGPWHGAEVAVRAVARLPDDVRLVMVGDGEERPAVQALADSLGVAGRVRWTGAVPRAVAIRTLAQCDVLVSPHTPLPGQPFFGSPTKLFEYMAIGRPIVASRLNQIGEVLDDGVTARLVTPGDVDELADAIDEVLRLPDRGRELGMAARREAASKHTWDERARTLLARLEQLGGSRFRTDG